VTRDTFAPAPGWSSMAMHQKPPLELQSLGRRRVWSMARARVADGKEINALVRPARNSKRNYSD